MTRPSRKWFLLLIAQLLWLGGCRSTKKEKEAPPPTPPPSLLKKTNLPRRGTPISDFERLAHWEVTSNAGEVLLSKNLSEAVWGWASAEITLKPNRPGPAQVRLVPKDPWIIQSQFDTILLWMLHQGEPGLRDNSFIRLQYRDAEGATGEWVLPYSPGPDIQMLHLRVTENIPGPVAVESLIWEIPARSGEQEKLTLDSLSIYQEVLSSLPQDVYYVRPFGYAPVFAPLRKNSVTLNFPDNPNAYRPVTRSEKSLHSLTRLEENRYLFSYESAGLQLGYRIDATPGMPKVDVILNGKVYPQLWQNALVEMPDGLPELRFARMSKERLSLQYTQGLQFELSLHGKTLQLEMNSLLENVQGLDLGRIVGEQGKVLPVVQVPFMRLAEDLRWPVYVLALGTDRYMVSCFPDWWYSLASRYERPQTSGVGDELGRLTYEKRWRGNRNMFRERLYFTVSERLQDVMPQPASPVDMYRAEAGELKWQEKNTLPTINLMSIHPLDEAWDDRSLARDAVGEWRRHPLAGYLIKSGLFARLPLTRMADLRDNRKENILLVPAVAQYPPWRFLDYDVRSVGAASYTQVQADAGALLQQVAAEWGGPVISRGGAEWFWSGLVSAVVPEFPLGLLELHPFLPHFAWRNINPFTQMLGLGKLDDFRLPTDQVRDEETLLNRQLACQVAYGAMGRIPDLRQPLLRTKSAWIQALLQPHFAGVRPERIAYWDGKRFLDAGEAMRNDVLVDSQLYIRLDDETEIWVNGNLTDAWSLRVDGRDVSLPPFGFVVRGNHLFVQNQPRQADQPGLCLMQTPDQIWVSSPDKEVDELGMKLQGSVHIQLLEDGGIQMDIGDWHGEAQFAADLLKLSQVGSVRGMNAKGEQVSDIRFERRGEVWILQSDASLRRLWISTEISAREMKFSP